MTIIPPILGSATLVTRNKSWELPTNCRKTMLELVRISRLNVCHYKGDFEPQTRGNHAMAEIAEPKYDTEAANENVHLVTQTLSPDLLFDLPAEATLKVDQLLLELCCSMDDWHHVSRFRARFSQRSPWSLTSGQMTEERYPGISGFAAQQTGLLSVFRVIRTNQPIAPRKS